MKFGLFSGVASPPNGEQLDRCVDEMIAEAQLAEESGFESIFFGEHHQDKDGYLPSPLIVATAVAAQTQRLHVGTSVVLLPLHHPVHLAEDVITLDIVSKGRVILGVGLGHQPTDFQPFAVPKDQRVARFEESVQIIRQCWRGEPFSFSGEHYTLDNVQIRPRPFQTPAPPLWIGASGPRAARRAGQLGDAFIAPPHLTFQSAISLVDTYRQAARAAGRQPQVALIRDAWVAQSRAEAEAVYGPELIAAYRYREEFRKMTELTLEDLAQYRIILGDPEACIGELHRWHEATSADYFILRLRHAHSGGPPHEKIHGAIQKFGAEVLPYCR